jgi:biotin-(acetyl-CoA carboxylase) ligase
MPALAATSTTPTLTLPPAYTLVSLREHADAYAHACRIAGEAGAGTFVWVRRFDVLEFAVVLEPEEPLASARRAVFAGMAAMAEGLATYAPPEKPIAFAWPTTLQFDGARIGGGRLGWPGDCGEDGVPEWLVFSGMVLASTGTERPGDHPDVTWLEEEGFDPAQNHAILESFARHLMLLFDSWTEAGFNAVADRYLARLPRDGGEGRRGIDGNGDLLIHRSGVLERVALLPGLEAASRYDPSTRLPRL